jgi:hypothetical protein
MKREGDADAGGRRKWWRWGWYWDLCLGRWRTAAVGELFLQHPYFFLQHSDALLVPIPFSITCSVTLFSRLPSYSIKLFFLILHAAMIEYKCQVVVSIINSAFFPLPRDTTWGRMRRF